MRLDVMRLVAFMASGTIWVAGTAWGAGALPLGLLALCFILPGSVALALAGERIGRVTAVLWVVTLVLLTALVAAYDGGVAAVIVTVVVASVCFGAWASSGLLLLHFLSGGRRVG